MEKLYINETATTPEVNFDTNGYLSIKGISTPDNVTEFYNPLFDWVREYVNSKPDSIKLDMFFDYLNTSSTRVMIEFIRHIDAYKNELNQIDFIWKFEDDDEDMQEFGEELQLVTGADIVLESVKAS